MRRRYNPTVMVSGNYYPSVFSVSIRDEKNFEQGIDGELLLALDTSLGVTSPEGGVVEVMVHRRALQPSEAAMNDDVGLVTRSRLLLGSISAAVASRRHATIYQLNYPLSVFLLASSSVPSSAAMFSALKEALLPPLFIATLRPFNHTIGLLALQVAHTEPSETSRQQAFDPHALLSDDKYRVKNITPRSLSFNQDAKESRRRWPTHVDSDEDAAQLTRVPHSNDQDGTISPLHMRSWLLTLERS